VVWCQICLKKSSAGKNYGESRLQIKWLLHYGDLSMIVYPLLTNSVVAIFHARMPGCVCVLLPRGAGGACIPFLCALEVWRELKDYSVKLERKGFTSPKDQTFDFHVRAQEIDLILLAMTVCHLWDARNAIRNGEPLKNPNSLGGRIKAYVEMIELHVLEPSSKHSHASICLPRWSSPRKELCLSNWMQFCFHLRHGWG
jgi:hypothetical protein